MNLLNKLTIKNLLLNKKRTIVTIIGIILSVALITAVASMYASGIQMLINYEKLQKGDYHVAFYDVSKNDAEVFKDNHKIDKLSYISHMGYANINSKNEYKPYVSVAKFTKNSLESLGIILVEGRLPENDTEIVIPTHLRSNGRVEYKVGDTITLDVGERVDSEGNTLSQLDELLKENDIAVERIINTKKYTYKIVGIIERPDYSIEPFNAPGYTLITYLDENNLGEKVDVFARISKKHVNKWYEVVAGITGTDASLFEKIVNSKATEEETNTFYEQFSKYGYEMYYNQYLIMLETNPIKNSGISGLGAVILVVLGIIVFTSIFCIKNSFDISITEKTKQYGMLKSIGATKKQIRKNVFYESTILGVFGIPLGILVGFLATYILILITNILLKNAIAEGFTLVFVVSLPAVLIAIALGFVTIYLSALGSARRASKISPIDSIRNSSDIKIKGKKLKTPKFINKLFGIGGAISYKNLKRNKKKYRTTIISIAVSVLVFISLYSFMTEAMSSVSEEIKSYDYNLNIRVYDNEEENLNKAIETTRLENVTNCTLYRFETLKIKGTHFSDEYMKYTGKKQDNDHDSYITVIALGKEQYDKYIKKLGLDYDYIKDKAILVDYRSIQNPNNPEQKKKLSELDFKKGDTIEGKISALIEENNFDYSIEIGATSKNIPFGLLEYTTKYLIVSEEEYNKVNTNRGFTVFYDSDNVSKLQDEVEKIFDGENYYINNIEEETKNIKNLFLLLGIFLYGFIIVISLIGITNIFNAITANMQLRRQEFAMLKSVGMTNKEFKKMIRLESIFMGLKSLLYGLPIGIVLSAIIHYLFRNDNGLPYRLPVIAIVVSILVVFILISLIMKYSMSKINKQNTIETIRNENI